MPEPDNIVLHLLREIRDDVRKLDDKVENLGADLRSEMTSLRADVASDIASLSGEMGKAEKRVNDQLVTLRRSVMEYHSTAVGHGMLYSELEERVRRIEQRLDISHTEPH